MTTNDFPSLCALHRSVCKTLGPLPALRFKQNGLWHHLTWNDYRHAADDIAVGLIDLGVQPGDRVAILSENRWEWLVADHAILSAGALDVPIHAPSTPTQIQYQLEQSGACGIFVSSLAQWEKVASVMSTLPDLKFVVCFDGELPFSALATCSWNGLRHSGQRSGQAGRFEIEIRESFATPDCLATIIYTSGTTGLPKGVMLTHGNFLTNSAAATSEFGFDCRRTWLNWLPFSHVFARLVDHYSTTRAGFCVALAQSSATVMDDIREIQPMHLSSVPRLLEKVWGYLATLPAENRADEARRMFGHRLIHISSGGAPLSLHVATGLHDAGILVLEGYGLTESSPIITFNMTGHWKFGTVGPAIDRVEVRIAEDGEILTRGPHVMKGYWNNPTATAETIRDGWLYTGDLGAIDSDGFLTITGRKKDLIVTSGGKNIAPSALEALLTSDPFIEQALVYGDARPFVTAIIVPKFERIQDAVNESGGRFSTTEEVVSDVKLLAWFQHRVDKVLAVVSQVERVKKIVILTRALSLDTDELTVTQKVRRATVFHHYQKYLEQLYQGSVE